MNIPKINNIDMEKYSSAITLSDMEIFVFPELMYSLVLANIMSPSLWKWKQMDTFKKLKGKGYYRRLMRLRQFIMDEYEFNLDLETWGLTKQQVEIERFSPFISPDDISRSNALFGYTGDKYYFDVDIRRHFGLDKYDSDTIPYWKTETIEAMNAFAHKPDYGKGAGECVSLATLYAAASFVVSGVPLEDIYLLLTPLHSQNFLDVGDGLITNNRRIVTKPMWFNGTAISMKAQRALKNEQITIVAHNSGHIHCFYDDATIDKAVFEQAGKRIGEYLTAEFDILTFSNFLRAFRDYQKYFQFCREHRGQKKFVKAETLFHYEHGSDYRIADETYDKLLDEVEDDDLTPYKLDDRMCCEQLRTFIEYEDIDVRKENGLKALKDYLAPLIPEIDEFIAQFVDFMKTEPRLPSIEKNFIPSNKIELTPDMSRDEIIEYLQSIRDKNTVADLAFYAYRDLEHCHWEPFIKASVERNPISITAAEGMSIDDAYAWIDGFVNESIYDGKRAAQPDEVVNYLRGDGLEKAITLANIIKSRDKDAELKLEVDKHDVVLNASCGKEFKFKSTKGLKKEFNI